MKSISEEMFKRFIIPFYILVLSLISASIIIKPKTNPYAKYHKFFIFLLGFITVIISQLSFKFVSKSNFIDVMIIITPILLIFIYYLFLLLKTKLKINTL